MAALLCTLSFPIERFVIPNVLPSQTVSQVSLSHNVTAVLVPKHRFFAMQPADFEEANERYMPPPFTTPSSLHRLSHAEPLAELLFYTASSHNP